MKYFLILVIGYVICLKESNNCNTIILNNFQLKGISKYDNKEQNYICSNIQNNCCTIADQIDIIKNIMEIEKNMENKVQTGINNWDNLIKSLSDFYAYKFENYILKLSIESKASLYYYFRKVSKLENKFLTKIKTEDLELKSKTFKDLKEFILTHMDDLNKRINYKFNYPYNIFRLIIETALHRRRKSLIKIYYECKIKKIDLNLTYDKLFQILQQEFLYKVKNTKYNNKKQSKIILKYSKNEKYMDNKLLEIIKEVKSHNNVIKIIENIKSKYKINSIESFNIKKSFFCIICNRDNNKYYNYNDNSITINSNLCQNIITLYLETLIDKYYKLFNYLEIIKNIIFSIDNENKYLEEEFRKVVYFNNKFKKDVISCLNYYDKYKSVDIKPNNACIKICNIYNLNKYKEIFDDNDKFVTDIINLWINFKKNINSNLSENKIEINNNNNNSKINNSNNLNINIVKKTNNRLLNKNKINLKTTINNIIKDKENKRKNNDNTKRKNNKKRKLIFGFIARAFNKVTNVVSDGLGTVFCNKQKEYAVMDSMMHYINFMYYNYPALNGYQYKILQKMYNNNGKYNNNLLSKIQNKFNNDFQNKLKTFKIKRIDNIFWDYDSRYMDYNEDTKNKISFLLDYYIYKNYPKDKIINLITKSMLQESHIFKNKTKYYKKDNQININKSYNRSYLNKKSVENKLEYNLMEHISLENNIIYFTYKFKKIGIDFIYASNNIQINSNILNKLTQLIYLKDSEYNRKVELFDKNIGKTITDYNNNNYVSDFNLNINKHFQNKNLKLNSTDEAKFISQFKDYYEFPKVYEIIFSDDYLKYYFENDIHKMFYFNLDSTVKTKRINFLKEIINYYF